MENISVSIILPNGNYNDKHDLLLFQHLREAEHVFTCIIISIGLPLTLVAIYALYSLVTGAGHTQLMAGVINNFDIAIIFQRLSQINSLCHSLSTSKIQKDHVAPIYIINLLISDLMQLCCMTVWEADPVYEDDKTVGHFYRIGLVASVVFMVCIALVRYLVIAHPLWFRFKHTIRTSVAVSVLVWLIAPVYFLTVFPWVSEIVTKTVFSIFLIIPFPLLIFFLVGTLRALSTSTSVSSDEKQRIVGILVFVLMTYTLLFLPSIIWPLATKAVHTGALRRVPFMFVKLSPLTDLFLYLFIRKETIGKLFNSVCCCKKESSDSNTNNVNDGNISKV